MKIGVLVMCAFTFFGCISSNPSSEVMIDTNAKTRKQMPGEAEAAPPLQVPIGQEPTISHSY